MQPRRVQHVLCNDREQPRVSLLPDDASNNIAILGFSILILCVILQGSSS